MNKVDLEKLEQVAITELLNHSHRWTEPQVGTAGKAHALADSDSEAGHYALRRLEALGLVVLSGGLRRGGIALTPAGLEALTYLSSAS